MQRFTNEKNVWSDSKIGVN